MTVGGGVRVIQGDCRLVLGNLLERFDAVVTDPPYGIGFMNLKWDDDVALKAATWRTIRRRMKPGAYLLAFASARTYHRMAVAIEDAGFVIHPLFGWIFGTGFPKATDLSKQFDKVNGAVRPAVGSKLARPGMARDGGNQSFRQLRGMEGRDDIPNPALDITAPVTDEAKQWEGWSYGLQALKPALEPICLAQVPIDGKRMVDQVRRHGVGALNIDACRVPINDGDPNIARGSWSADHGNDHTLPGYEGGFNSGHRRSGGGRWPANVVHDGSDEAVAAFPDTQSNSTGAGMDRGLGYHGGGEGARLEPRSGDAGSAARFFYSAKADAEDRWGSKHPTVKPVELMRWLVRLVTPPGGLVLDPFAGSGTTGVACLAEGVRAVLIEGQDEHVADINARLAFYRGEGAHSLAARGRNVSRAKASGGDTPLFGGESE